MQDGAAARRRNEIVVSDGNDTTGAALSNRSSLLT
jgi:hypothetical protein